MDDKPHTLPYLQKKRLSSEGLGWMVQLDQQRQNVPGEVEAISFADPTNAPEQMISGVKATQI